MNFSKALSNIAFEVTIKCLLFRQVFANVFLNEIDFLKFILIKINFEIISIMFRCFHFKIKLLYYENIV